MKFNFSAQEYRSMPEDRRKAIQAGEFGRWKMVQALRHVAAFWWVEPNQSRVLLTPPGVRVHNGSATFVEIEGSLLCITAAHVYREYLAAEAHYRVLQCRLGEGGFVFDAKANLCSVGDADGPDIATFHVTPEILNTIGKEAIIAKSPWHPPLPFAMQQTSIAGFPGSSRIWIDEKGISFGLYCGGPGVGTVTENQITLPFEREFWVDASGMGLPPIGMDLGGVSGGPLLIPTEIERDWSFDFAGVISEMPSSARFETITVVPAHLVGPNGAVLTQPINAPRHYVPVL